MISKFKMIPLTWCKHSENVSCGIQSANNTLYKRFSFCCDREQETSFVKSEEWSVKWFTSLMTAWAPLPLGIAAFGERTLKENVDAYLKEEMEHLDVLFTMFTLE